MQDVFIGVDVSQDTLDVAGCPGKKHAIVANRKRDIRLWLKSVPAGSRIAMESTGRYHQELAELASEAGLHVYVLNPKRVWHAARGDGRRGKTDRIDAEVIAKFLRDHIDELHEWHPATAVHRELNKLERRRHCIERHCTALAQSLKDVDSLAQEIRGFSASMKAMRQAIDKRIQDLLAADAELARKSAQLTTVPTIGQVGSATLTTLFSQVQFKSSDAVVAFVGLDVRAKDSGKHRGQRRLTKMGPPHIRREVWLMGFAGTHTKLFKPIYQALLARGIATTEAIMILGRRILRIAWAVWRKDRPFDPQLVGKQA